METWSPTSAEEDVFRYVDISSVDRESKSIVGATELAVDDAPSRARQLLKANDVLVSTVRPNLNAVAMVPNDFDGAVGSTGFTVLRANQKRLLPQYLFHWVRTPMFVADMVKKATGASYPAVSDRIVLDSEIPAPPLSEQRRIADILDKADAIRRKRKEAIALTEELLRSAFLDMFGDPVTNPKGWPVKPLGDLVDIRGGGTPSRARPDFFAGHVPWATAKDFRSEFMSDTEEHVSEDAIASSATKLVPQGTILVVVKSKILMRRLPVAISTVPLCFNQDVKGLVVRDLSEGPYIAAHIRMAQRKLLELARGVNTEGLTLDHLRGHPVMRPPVDEVHRFVQLEATIRRSTDVNARGAQAAGDLFDSLVARAFSGELEGSR